METTKCQGCGRNIKHTFEWEGKQYGIECWKKLALPIIEAERKLAQEKRFATWMIKCQAIIKVLKAKDLSRITSDFKLRFIPSVIAQVEGGKPLSSRQIEIAKSFYNNSDWYRSIIFECIVDGDTNTIAQADSNLDCRGKLIKLAKEILGNEYPEQKPVISIYSGEVIDYQYNK